MQPGGTGNLIIFQMLGFKSHAVLSSLYYQTSESSLGDNRLLLNKHLQQVGPKHLPVSWLPSRPTCHCIFDARPIILPSWKVLAHTCPHWTEKPCETLWNALLVLLVVVEYFSYIFNAFCFLFIDGCIIVEILSSWWSSTEHHCQQISPWNSGCIDGNQFVEQVHDGLDGGADDAVHRILDNCDFWERPQLSSEHRRCTKGEAAHLAFGVLVFWRMDGCMIDKNAIQCLIDCLSWYFYHFAMEACWLNQ